MKFFLLSFFLTVCCMAAFAQTTVTYTQRQANYYATDFATGGGCGWFNQGTYQLGMYAHSGANTCVAWRKFRTDGSGSATGDRALQVGDVFTLTMSAARAYGRIGFALLASPTSTSSYADAQNNYALQINLDGPQYNGGSTYGVWYGRNGVASTFASSFGGVQGTGVNTGFHDFTFILTLTAPDRMNVTMQDNTSTLTFTQYDVLLNTSNPITDYSIYYENDYDGGNNQNIYWGQGAVGTQHSVTNNFTLPLGNSNSTFAESVVIPDGLDAASTSTVSSNILTKAGTGTLTLSGTNTYTGLTNVNGGTLSIAADANLGTAPGSATANSITFGGGTLAVTTGFTLSANRGITVNGASTLDVTSGQTLTWGGILAGASTLNKTSAGTLVMNTTTGGTFNGLTVSAGTVTLSGTAGNQMLGGVTVNSTATLSMTAANQFGTTSTPPFLTINGSFTSTNNSQNIAVTGTTGAISMGTGTLTINNTGTDTYAGTIAGTGGLIKGNTGTQTLSGANTSLTGGVAVQQGTLKLGNANAINTTNAVTLGNSTNNGTLSLNGNNLTVTSITTSGSGTTNTINNNNATGGTLTVNTSAGDTYSGILANGATGTLSVTKTGTDTLTLSGTNTFTGTTTITAGTLKLGAANTIGSSSQIKMNGGNLSTNSFSDAVGTLLLTANSSIELTNGGTQHTLTFADSHLIGWTGATTLTIYHWVGTAGVGGGATGTNDKIIVGVGGLTATQLAQINFGGGYSSGATITASGELVPATVTISSVAVAAPGSCAVNCSGYVGNTITISGTNLATVTTVKVGATYSTATNISSFTYNSGPGTITFAAVTGASGFIFINDGVTTVSSTTTYTDLGYLANTAGNWSTGGTWLNGAAPVTTVDVTIAANVTLNQAATVSSLTINPGKTFTSSDATARTLTITNNTTGTTLNNGGTWANGTGASTVVFSGLATHTISGTLVFNNLTTNSTLNPGTGVTVNGTLMLNSGGSIITNPVAYGSASTLYYNVGGGAGAKINSNVNEWPNTGAVNIYIDNDTWLQLASSKTITGNVYVNSGALQSTGAHTLTMNTSGSDTITVKNGNGTPGAIYGTDNGSGNDLTLTIANGCTTFFIGDASSNSDDNKKFIHVNVNGTLRLQTGIDVNYGAFQVGSTGVLRIDGGGYIQGNDAINGAAGIAPTYSTGSLLKYSVNGSYSRGVEWSATTGAGYPYNVQLSGSTGTNLDLGNGASSFAFQCAGNLTIDANSNMNMATSSMTNVLTIMGNIYINGTLTLSNSGGGDIHVYGNWYRNAATGTFTTNNRSVFFDGANNSYITVVGGGTETFAYLRENLSAPGKYLKPNNNLPDTTNIVINGSPGDVLNLTGSGGFDINGRKVSIDHNRSASPPEVWIYVDQSRTITDSAGLGNGEFKFMSSANPNQPTWFTSSVHNNGGVGALTFDTNVLVSIADGSIDFGNSSGTPITTIQGTLQVKLGGSVGQTLNPCTYAAGSTLRFANDIDYQVPSNDQTWAAGASGPGVPDNVSVNDSGTNLTINSPRSVTGNLTINDGILTLNSVTGNSFEIGGNWSRSGSHSNFVNNAVAKVVFNGAAAQTITCTASSNVETFRDVEIANSTGSTVTLGGSTTLLALDSIIFTRGVLTTGSNTVVTPDTCIFKAGTGNTNYSVSWVNGNLKRFFTSGSNATWAFPVGNATHGCLANVKSNLLTGISYFTAAFGPVGTGSNGQLNAYETSIAGNYHTAYTAINPAGSWKIEPDAQPTGGTTYDISVYFDSFTGLADNQFGILKRPIGSSTFAAFKPAGGTLSATNGAGRTQAGGYALRMGLGSFSEFAVGQANAVLPITLVSFAGSNEGDVNNLYWNTASEINSSYFSVERSFDAATFAEIGTVKAAGTSVINLSYAFVDDKPVQGINYYRLKLVDQDGQSTYSEIIAITVGQAQSAGIVVYPNPAVGNISVDVVSATGANLTYAVTDMLGRTVENGNITSVTGINHYTLPTTGWVHGIYFLNVRDEQSGVIKTTRFIKAE